MITLFIMKTTLADYLGKLRTCNDEVKCAERAFVLNSRAGM